MKLQHAASRPPLRVVPLTALNGHESFPAFAPDGEQVAFTWDGENEDNADIYVKIVGSSEVRRLTTHPADDALPSWSPDAHEIAFVRFGPDGGRIHLVSPLGGADRKVSDFRALGAAAWSPDGRWLAVGLDVGANASRDVAGIFLIPVTGGEPRRLTRASGSGYDLGPTFSPDGHRLAYASCGSAMKTGGCDVYVLALNEDYAPLASGERLTNQSVGIFQLAWSRDGASVIYDGEQTPGTLYLWRVMTGGGHTPERLEIAGAGAAQPASVGSRDRLAFVRTSDESSISRVEPGSPPKSILQSTAWDWNARYSPDGGRIVFSSSRSGDANEIWLAASDGSAVYQLTHGPSRWQGSPTWSPDGRRIAFDAQSADGHTDIWLIDADGGAPHQLTRDVGDENMPTWSRDGQWVYFSADQGKGRDVWRVPSAGGPYQRMTHGGSSLFACESPDGKYLIYERSSNPSPLLAVPVTGGPVRELVTCVQPDSFGVGPSSIFYAECENGPLTAIHQLDPVTNQDRLFVSVGRGFDTGQMAVAPNEKAVLIRRGALKADLMLIENFR